MQVILAVDVGSSSVRCSAYRIVDHDDDATVVEAIQGCNAQCKIRSVEPNTGRIILTGSSKETGSAYNLLEEIDACIDTTLQALRQSVDAFQVVGLGFSTFVMNLVGVDKSGAIVGPEATLSYACNSPKVAETCRDLRSQLGEAKLKELYQKTGAPLHSAYALAQLCALYSNPQFSEVVQRIHQWQTIASLCLSKWQGVPFLPISYSEASWTGLLNFCSCRWEQDALDFLPMTCREALPPLADYSDSNATIPKHLDKTTTLNPYWERWPELGGNCRLFLGLGDGACANFGSKCCSSARIAVTVGTSAAARVYLPLSRTKLTTDNFRVPPGLFCYRVDQSHVLVGGALTDGGSVVEWARSLLNLNDKDAFETCMEQVEALALEEGSTPSLTVVPFLSGERSTGYRDGATGCVFGLTRETTPALFMKACMEGVMLRIKAILDLVCQVIEKQDGNGKPYVVVSGNAMEKNALWRQMLADSSGMEILLDSDIVEGTSRGVARLVAIALATERDKEDSSVSRMSDEPILSPTVSSPRMEMTNGYWSKTTKAQDDLIDSLSPLW